MQKGEAKTEEQKREMVHNERGEREREREIQQR